MHFHALLHALVCIQCQLWGECLCAQDRILTVNEAAYAMNACQFALYFSGTVGHSFTQIENLVKQFGGQSQRVEDPLRASRL